MELTNSQKEKIKEIITEKLGYDVDDVLDNTNLKDELCMDSLDCIELMIDIEKEFNVIIPETLSGNVVVVSDIYECLNKILK